MAKPDGIGGGVNFFDSLHLKEELFGKLIIWRFLWFPEKKVNFIYLFIFLVQLLNS